ncbi:hypothetical protein SCREM2_gp34 [Synechococcus phage S-CREM2]|nr:hypothetical protein SCREM2_gp34 [Synechococcus phage S-CREM2]
MIQFNQDEVARLIRGVRCYQDRTGSEYLFDEYEKLADKLQNYQEQVTTD